MEASVTYDFFISDAYYQNTRRSFVVSRSASIRQSWVDRDVNTAARWLENYSTIQDMANSITDIMQ
jgi:hypothetical protein